MTWSRKRLALASVALAALVGTAAGSAAGADGRKQASPARVVLFSSDGMRPDLMERFAHRKLMPTYLQLIRNGVVGRNGMRQAFPPNTGVGWYTMASGAYPAQNGSTNNTFYDTTTPWTSSTSAFATGVAQADMLQQDAERNGKSVVCFEWDTCGALVPEIQGPVVDFDSTYSKSAVVVNFDLPGQPAKSAPFSFATSYDRVTLAPAAGWTNPPTSYSPAKETTLTLADTTRGARNVDRTYDLYVYDSTNDGKTNYDRVLAVPSTAGKNAAQKVADLKQGDWADVKVTLTGTEAGHTAGFWLKAIRIAPDLSQLWVYGTEIARVSATYNGCSCKDTFEEYLASHFPSYASADFAPLEGGTIDEDTYVEQGLDLYQRSHVPMFRYIMSLVPEKPDLLMVGFPVTDEFQHQFLGLITPSSPQGGSNPSYDDADLNGVRDRRVEERTGYIESAYRGADRTLSLARELDGGGVTTFAGSDHGFGPQFLALNADEVLRQAGLAKNPSSSNCRPSDPSDPAKACWAGGTVQVYVNPSITGSAKAAIVDRIVTAFGAITDPDHPTWKPILKVLRKDELRDVDGSNSLYPTRSGDVVVVSQPPYQWDAPTTGKVIAPSGFFGQHGYLPDTVDLGHNVNMHATFVAAGPGIASIRKPIPGVQAVDLAPTIARLLGIPAPQDAQGKVLEQILGSGHSARPVAHGGKHGKGEKRERHEKHQKHEKHERHEKHEHNEHHGKKHH